MEGGGMTAQGRMEDLSLSKLHYLDRCHPHLSSKNSVDEDNLQNRNYCYIML